MNNLTPLEEFQRRREQQEKARLKRIAERICEQQEDDAFRQSMIDIHIKPLFNPDDAA